ncbi:von Willebrand factor A domain-containing protein 5A-like isoform X2 [Watersipora subatra]|uniref:von Willebrand factor A domain-containing protein 5A-like isoform X2 n=1 Tax=Watersipora subatra TaxID=2589382 RepID=UPI00355BBD66
MESRKHRWGLYFAVEDFNKPRPRRTVQDSIDISLLKDIRPVSIDSIKLFVTVHGLVADVTCQSTFTNTESDHIDGFFLFPVDPGACLYHFEASLCGRKVVAASRDKGENHELSLLEELDGEGILLEETSSDMFTCHIGVVPSDEQVEVMFQYSIELMISPEGHVPFIFPSFVPREFQARYMDSAMANQKMFNVDGYSFDFYFQAIVAGNYMIQDVLSREVLEIDYLDQTHYNAKLTLAGSYLPNRDFAFTMKYADIESPHILVQKGGNPATFDHVVMKNQCGLFTLFHRLNKAKPKSMKGEFIFCVDRSPGMRGYKMQLARETLLYFIKGLPSGCYFNIVSFGAAASPLFKSSRVYNQYNVMKAIKCQLKMRADMAGHNMLSLLEHIYSQPIIAGHPKQVFLITEGTIANKHECVEYVSARAEYARLFPIGIGETCERNMITGLARAGNGKPHFLNLNEKPYNTVLECLKQAMQPGLTNLVMEFDTPAGVTCLTIPPTIPSIVFAEEKLQIYILIRGEPEDPNDSSCSVTLRGMLGKNEPYSHTSYFNLSESMVNENLPIHRLALKTEIIDLERSIANAMGADDILENEYHIVQAGIGANITSRFTPLVGLDAVTGQEVEGFPIIRLRADELAYSRAVAPAAGSVYKSLSRLTLSRPGESPSAFVRGIFDRQSGGQRANYSMADSRIHDFDDELEDGLEMEYTYRRPPATVADLDSELALSEIYMGVSDKNEWDKFKESLKHPNGLTKFQHPDGYWMLDKKIAYAFCSVITEVKAENPLQDDLVWTTILALNWLKTNFPIRKTEWKESEDWARAWLYQQNLEGYSLDELLELAFGLKHLNGQALFKPPARPERQISAIEEEGDETQVISEPVTYMKQESITMIERDIDDMAEEEYLNDEVEDIKTTAIEISASTHNTDKPMRSEDAIKDHPGHLNITSPTQHRVPPGVNSQERRLPVRTGSRHVHTTTQRQDSFSLGQRGSTSHVNPMAGRYGEMKERGAPQLSKPLPSARSSLRSQTLSSWSGLTSDLSSPHQPSVSGQTPTRPSRNFSQLDPLERLQADQQESERDFHLNPQDQRGNVTTNSLSRNVPPDGMRNLDRPSLQSEHRPSLQSEHRSAFHQPATSHQSGRAEPSTLRAHLHPDSPYKTVKEPSNPLPLDALLPSPRERLSLQGESPEIPLQTALVPTNNTSPSTIPVVGTEQSAQRPNVLPLRHTISTDIMIQESQEVPSCESHYSEAKSEEAEQVQPINGLSNARKTVSSYSVNKPAVPPSINTNKPKRSISFKQRLGYLKENLLFAADIKSCRKHNDLHRMNSLRSSIRSGTSPYAIDYDETDAILPRGKKIRKPKHDERRRADSKPVSSSGSMRTPSPVYMVPSRPTTPLSVVSEVHRQPPTPAARSRPASPVEIAESKSRPTTPNFRQGGRAPGAHYFRPRTPSAVEVNAEPVSEDEVAPLVQPVPSRIMTNYGDSPRSSYRSQQTFL